MTDSGDQQPAAFSVPWFLRLLCYLTIFGSTYFMFSAISGLFSPEEVSKTMDQAMQSWMTIFEPALKSDPKAEKDFEAILEDISFANSVSNIRDYSFFSLVANGLTMIGAFLMLRLRKNGFRLYLLGTLIGIISPLLVFGSDNFLGFSYAFMGAIMGILFGILYALKMKHMH
ncbi:MAG: hypothetical protein FJX83_04060 [Bacteroidetes bacterium]|nr:hypothetical protein [Bacteroidota bacterium]